MPGVLRARALRVGAGRTPAGMPGPTGAKKSARTSTTGPPGKCWAAWRSVAAPAGLPTWRVGSSAADGSKTSKGLIAREGYDHPAAGARIKSGQPHARTAWGTGSDHGAAPGNPQTQRDGSSG